MPAHFIMPSHDFIQRFLFQDFNVRGEIAKIEETYRSILAQQDYPDAVRILLGEILAATALLSATIKFRGALTLQVKTSGRIRLLMAECRNQTDLRAIARLDEESDGPWLGEGQLVITLEPTDGERYQGIVSLGHDSLARAIETYFLRSEQLGTRIWLFADQHRAGGLMIQRLPDSADRPALPALEEDWQRIILLSDTVTAPELLELEPHDLLTRLFHQEHVRLFDSRGLRFQCNCSRERSASAIKFLGYDDAMELLADKGEVEIDCQFCHARYRFGDTEVRAVFEREAAPRGTTIH